jgi:hypothetical protein
MALCRRPRATTTIDLDLSCIPLNFFGRDRWTCGPRPFIFVLAKAARRRTPEFHCHDASIRTRRRVRRYNPNTDEDLLNKAYVYAMRAHGNQKRASGDPYFAHPLEVAAILTDLKLDDATIVAAMLHDTIEDTDATREEIDRLFGTRSARWSTA